MSKRNVQVSEEPKIVIKPDADGVSKRVDLMLGGKSISRLSIVPFTLRIGSALVRMDGIGGVGTDPKFRNRGYSRRVLEAAIEEMQRGDGALSMLYGIRDFYPKFGFATAGPDHLVYVHDLERDNTLPAGWKVRPFALDDLPAVQALYATSILNTTGTAVRPDAGGVWSYLLQAADGSDKDECRVVEGPDGKVRGYLWRARWCWYVQHKLETDNKDALVLGEVVADSPLAADAVLAACRLWAKEEAAHRSVKRIVLAFPPQQSLAYAAMCQDVRFVRNYSACGGSMARVLNVTRLLQSLAPELTASLQRAGSTFTGSLVFHTDSGDATLHLTPDTVTVTDGALTSPDALHLFLPQYELARMALGAFPPGELLARLPMPVAAEAERLLEHLFPLRFPHMHLPDRY